MSHLHQLEKQRAGAGTAGSVAGLLAGHDAVRASSASGTRRTLGILVCETPGEPPFPERAFYRNLSEMAPALGLEVAVFSPHSIDWRKREVLAYRWSPGTGGWTAERRRLPSVLYDRCFFGNREVYLEYREAIRKLREDPGVQFLGNGLLGKGAVFAALSEEERFAPLLPPTEALEEPRRQLRQWLDRFDAVFLKPETGSQGKGVLAIHRVPPNGRRTGSYAATGRDEYNRAFRLELRDRREMIETVEAFTRRRSYLLQPYLDLVTDRGEPFDLRALVQKDARGLWRLAGIAARIGRPGGLTSNLHGGGTAERADRLLERLYGPETSRELLDRIREVSVEVPPVLERRFGRLAELGLDIGVDRRQKLWLIEANSKPGRSVFARIADTAARRRALWNPLRYARYLLDRIPGEET
ncbi:YheC/YheD family protein [Paenibacillus thermoaerophilus]|uniref:YheC/YheD family protein n=1 Tax=Paenibacillus thermoaerophilus TaxID=1215385 RepID=A0ABW2UYW0_9BACL|nr:YheC/YheD family protein [Paenibacillus thermoaerophilus]TMV16032.1 YheC/YheD family protein [Paenibacillus thermoaerophilus]